VDLIARWGGEEFVIGLTGTPEAGALLVAERLRVGVEGLAVPASDGTVIPVTASFGVAQWDRGEPADVVIDRADRAMYLAKKGGRNRVCVLGPPSLPALPAADLATA
jgi:diguanylate cyclase (GGDEF)-like protein